MADTDKTLAILIQIKAELSQLQKTREELLEMKRQAIAMGVSTGDLDAQLGKLDSDIARLGKKTVPEAGEGMKFFNIHTKETHRLLHELGRVSPEVGAIMRAVFNPQALGIIGVVIALKSVVEWIGEYQTKIKEIKDTQDQITVNIWDNMRQSAASVARSAAEYADAIKQIEENADTLKPKQDAEKKLLDAKVEAHKKLLDLMEQEAIASLPTDHTKADEDAVHKRFATKKQEFDLAAEKENISQLENFRQEAVNRSAALKRVSDFAESQKEDALKNPAAAADAARLTVLESKQLELKKAADPARLAELKQELAAAQRTADLAPDPQAKSGALINIGILSKKIKTLEDAQEALDKNQAEIDNLTTKQREYAESLDKLTKAASRALDDYRKASEAVSNFNNQIDAAKGVYSAHIQSVGEQQAKQQGIDFAPRARSLIEQAEEIAGRTKGISGLSKNELEFLQTIGSQIAGRSLTGGEADRMFEGVKGNVVRTQQFIERMLAAVSAIPSTILPHYEQRLSQLENQLRNLNYRQSRNHP